MTFAYRRDRRVRAVADVELRRFAPGRTLGIVGPTGAGKSTLLHLLLRHYAPQSGRIRFGDVPLADYSLAALRAALAWVPQEPFLFSATIAENIALARPDATRDEVDACRADGGPARGRAALRRRLRHARRRARRHAVGRPAPARGDRARAAGRRAAAAARRCAVGGRHRHRGAHPRAPARSARRPHGDHREPPPVGRRRRRRDRRAEGTARIVERGTHDALLARDGWYAAQWRYQQLEAEPRGNAHDGADAPDGRSRTCAASAGASAAAALALLWRAARPDRRQIAWARCWLAVAGLLEAAGPIFGKRFIDHYLLPRNADVAAIALLLGGYLATGLARDRCIRYFQLVRLAGLATRSVRRLRESVYAHVLRLPMSFFDRAITGQLVSRITNDTEAVKELYTQVLFEILVGLTVLVRRRRRDAVARLAADADRAAAGAGDHRPSCWGYQRLSAPP